MALPDVCTPCSYCAVDQVVLWNCTPERDIKCDKKCYSKDRYYDDDKGDCLFCSKCCHDEKDVVENECKEKLRGGSNMICSFDSSINRCYKSTPSPQKPTIITNQGTTIDYTSPSQGSKHTVPPTTQPSRHPSSTKATENKVLLISVSVPVVILALVIFGSLFICKTRQMCSYPWCNRDTEAGIPDSVNNTSQSCGVHYKLTEGNLDVVGIKLVKCSKVCNHGITSTESMEPLLGEGNQESLSHFCQKDSKLLSSLLNAPDLQEISECLDTPMAGVGNYLAVAQHYGLNHYKISSVLKKHERGPSTALIEWLAARYVKLTVREFATVVRETAKRDDVVQLLEAYDKKGEDFKSLAVI